MERKPRSGRREESQRQLRRQGDGANWPYANATFIQVAQGYRTAETERRLSWRVGLYVQDGETPRARIAMEPDQALQLAKALIATAGTVEHLQQYHQGGDRNDCGHPTVSVSEEKLEQLVDEAFGPVADALDQGRRSVMEAVAILVGVRTLCLDFGVFAPEGTTVMLPVQDAEALDRRVDELLAPFSQQGKMIAVLALTLAGQKDLMQALHLAAVTAEEKDKKDSTVH